MSERPSGNTSATTFGSTPSSPQILAFSDADLEKLYQFSRFLLRKLPVTRDKLPVEITENINMASYRIQETSKAASAHSPTKSPTGRGHTYPRHSSPLQSPKAPHPVIHRPALLPQEVRRQKDPRSLLDQTQGL